MFERDLRIKSDEIAKLNREIVNFVTGGNSFRFMEISINDDRRGGSFVVLHQGDHPLYDVQARIFDIPEFIRHNRNMTFNNWNRINTIINISNISKGPASMLGPQVILDGSKYD